MWIPNDAEKDQLRHLYSECDLTVDRLPYTETFELLYGRFNVPDVPKHDFFMALTNMRKRKELPRKAR